MEFLYYPGCSLEGSAIEYNSSTRAVMSSLGIDLIEIEDWTCCGASASDTISPLLSLVLPARNLALARQSRHDTEVIAPCSACYLNLRRVNDRMSRDEWATKNINTVLAEENLAYSGSVTVRHLLDVLSTETVKELIASQIKRMLRGIRVAPYYGCQALRPYAEFDDPEHPISMNDLIAATGAQVYDWSMGARCCGAGLMTTKRHLALELTGEILKAAQGADCIVTVCPMCQMNLEFYQKKISTLKGMNLGMTILYLPQLIGLALGISSKELELQRNFALLAPFESKLHSVISNLAP
jgi:heterodisulfide reductase subunit B2